MSQTNDEETFGGWVFAQEADCPIAELVTAARAGPPFALNGSPKDVRLHLSAMQADGAWFSVVDDAETDWMGH